MVTQDREIAPNVYADEYHIEKREAWLNLDKIKGIAWREGVITVAFDGDPADWALTLGALYVLDNIIAGRANEQPSRVWWGALDSKMPSWWRDALFSPDLVGEDRITEVQARAVIAELRRLVDNQLQIIMTCNVEVEDDFADLPEDFGDLEELDGMLGG